MTAPALLPAPIPRNTIEAAFEYVRQRVQSPSWSRSPNSRIEPPSSRLLGCPVGSIDSRLTVLSYVSVGSMSCEIGIATALHGGVHAQLSVKYARTHSHWTGPSTDQGRDEFKEAPIAYGSLTSSEVDENLPWSAQCKPLDGTSCGSSVRNGSGWNAGKAYRGPACGGSDPNGTNRQVGGWRDKYMTLDFRLASADNELFKLQPVATRRATPDLGRIEYKGPRIHLFWRHDRERDR